MRWRAHHRSQSSPAVISEPLDLRNSPSRGAWLLPRSRTVPNTLNVSVRTTLSGFMRSGALRILELHVLGGGRDGHRHQVDRVVGDARPAPDEPPGAPDWREHHAVDRELLNAVEQNFALRGVALPRLLLEQLVDVRIAAIGVTSLRVDECLRARGRIPRIPRGREKKPSELLLLPRGIERRPLHHAH